MNTEDYRAMIDAVPDEDFPLVMRMQLESADIADLPVALRDAIVERASRLGIEIK